MESYKNYFELFSLPVDFDVNSSDLNANFRQLQKVVHPDKFVKGGDQERLRSVQQAGLINEAYDMLKNPVQRARYMLELNGMSLDKEDNNGLSPGFLMQQIELREQIDEAKNNKDTDTLEQFSEQINQLLNKRLGLISELFRQQPPGLKEIVDNVQQAQFFVRLQESVNDTIVDIESSED